MKTTLFILSALNLTIILNTLEGHTATAMVSRFDKEWLTERSIAPINQITREMTMDEEDWEIVDVMVESLKEETVDDGWQMTDGVFLSPSSISNTLSAQDQVEKSPNDKKTDLVQTFIQPEGSFSNTKNPNQKADSKPQNSVRPPLKTHNVKASDEYTSVLNDIKGSLERIGILLSRASSSEILAKTAPSSVL